MFPADDLCESLDEDVDELNFGLADAVGVGNVPGAAGGGGVDAGGAADLEAHFGGDLFEVGARGEKGHFYHATGAKTGAQVGGTSQNPTQMIVMHEIVT